MKNYDIKDLDQIKRRHNRVVAYFLEPTNKLHEQITSALHLNEKLRLDPRTISPVKPYILSGPTATIYYQPNLEGIACSIIETSTGVVAQLKAPHSVMDGAFNKVVGLLYDNDLKPDTTKKVPENYLY